MTDQPVRARVRLPEISSRTWEHPTDRGALVALRRLKGFDTVLRKVSGLISERSLRLVFLGNAVRADERQFRRVHGLLADAAATLDMTDVPEVFVAADPRANAICIGMDQPFLVVNSGLLDMCDDEELRFVLGHELGHALSGHSVYRTLLMVLIRLTQGLSAIPLAGLPLRAIVAALTEWSRKSELSSDRAGLLACQDPAAALRVHMKLASGGHLEDVDTSAFLDQAAEYEAVSGSLRDSFLKFLLLMNRAHPFAVMRAGELRRWVDSGAYARVLAGDYARRGEDDAASVSEEAKAAARSYQDAFETSQDPLTKLVADIGGTVDSVRDWVARRTGSPKQ